MEQHLSFDITGDGGSRDSDGHLYVMGRIDDVINVAGHRLSTADGGRTRQPSAVAERAVIGITTISRARYLAGCGPQGRRHRRACRPSPTRPAIRDEIGPVAALRRVDAVAALPKTRSGQYSARPCGESPTARTRRPFHHPGPRRPRRAPPGPGRRGLTARGRLGPHRQRRGWRSWSRAATHGGVGLMAPARFARRRLPSRSSSASGVQASLTNIGRTMPPCMVLPPPRSSSPGQKTCFP